MFQIGQARDPVRDLIADYNQFTYFPGTGYIML